MTWSTLFPNFPTGDRFCQLKSTPWDGEPPGGTNATDDCGPTCVSAITDYVTGVYIPGDAVMDAMKGQGYKGLTSTDDLRGFLEANCSIPTSLHEPNSPYGTATGSLLNLVWEYTVKGLPLIELRWWQYPNSGFKHWCVAIGVDPQYAWIFDPWTGTIVAESYQRHGDMYQGVLFSCDRPRDLNL